MSLSSLLREYQRIQRIKNPQKKDYCSYLLIGIMGPEWWVEHGFEREYRVGKFAIDLANPELKIAIEGDGRRWHADPLDVVRDQARDEYLRRRGWCVARFWYDELKYRGPKVRARILTIYEGFAPLTEAQVTATKRMMRKNGFRV
jgi:very-short-patch-repair endonuclease